MLLLDMSVFVRGFAVLGFIAALFGAAFLTVWLVRKRAASRDSGFDVDTPPDYSRPVADLDGWEDTAPPTGGGFTVSSPDTETVWGQQPAQFPPDHQQSTPPPATPPATSSPDGTSESAAAGKFDEWDYDWGTPTIPPEDLPAAQPDGDDVDAEWETDDATGWDTHTPLLPADGGGWDTEPTNDTPSTDGADHHHSGVFAAGEVADDAPSSTSDGGGGSEPDLTSGGAL